MKQVMNPLSGNGGYVVADFFAVVPDVRAMWGVVVVLWGYCVARAILSLVNLVSKVVYTAATVIRPALLRQFSTPYSYPACPIYSMVPDLPVRCFFWNFAISANSSNPTPPQPPPFNPILAAGGSMSYPKGGGGGHHFRSNQAEWQVEQ